MIVGLGVAAEKSNQTGNLAELRNHFESLLKASLKDKLQVNFEDQPRLPNTSSLCFKGVDAGKLLENCDEEIEASRSAACHSSNSGASSVLTRSGLSEDEAKSTLRFSIGRFTTKNEIETAAKLLHLSYLKCSQ